MLYKSKKWQHFLEFDGMRVDMIFKMDIFTSPAIMTDLYDVVRSNKSVNDSKNFSVMVAEAGRYKTMTNEFIPEPLM